MHKSSILVIICLIFIGGLFLVSIFQYPQFIWGYLFFSKKGEITEFNDKNQEITFLGYIYKQPDERSGNTKLFIKTTGIKTENKAKKTSGKILITLNRYPKYKYGDELIITGKLKTPTVFEDFNYKGYLAKDGIYSIIYYPKIKSTGRSFANPIYKVIYSFKNKIKQAIERIMPLPEIAILEALTLGSKRSLPENLKQQLNKVGLRHIVAISGMHIMIICDALLIILIGLGLWKNQAFYLALLALGLFIIMIGAPASAIRAGIMGGILLFAEKIGRLNSSARAVLFVACIMLIFNPLLLKFDVGFQLSFLAVLGIIYFKPIFSKLLDKLLPKKIKNWIEKGKIRKKAKEVIPITLAAQVTTLPILVYNFGRIPIISLLANILILPALPYIMGAGFIFGLGATFWYFLGKILIWPTWFVFAYITKLVKFLSKIPFATKEISNVHWIWLAGYYVLLIGFLLWYKKKKNQYF